MVEIIFWKLVNVIKTSYDFFHWICVKFTTPAGTLRLAQAQIIIFCSFTSLPYFELDKNWMPNVIIRFVHFLFVHLVNFTVSHVATKFPDQPETRQTRKTFFLCATTALNLIGGKDRKKSHTHKKENPVFCSALLDLNSCRFSRKMKSKYLRDEKL